MNYKPIIRSSQPRRTSNATAPPKHELELLNSPHNLSSHSSSPSPPQHATLMWGDGSNGSLGKTAVQHCMIGGRGCWARRHISMNLRFLGGAWAFQTQTLRKLPFLGWPLAFLVLYTYVYMVDHRANHQEQPKNANFKRPPRTPNNEFDPLDGFSVMLLH